MARGKRLSNDNAKIDSAVVCLTFLMERYERDNHPKKDAPAAIEACNLLGHIYLFKYNDFSKAYYNLHRALDISGRENNKDFLNSINNNLGALYRTAGELMHDSKMKQRGLLCLKENFNNAIGSKNWKPAISSILNVGSIALHEHNIPTIRKELDTFRKTPIPKDTPYYRFAILFVNALRLFDNKDYAGSIAMFEKMEQELADINGSDRHRLQMLNNKFTVLLYGRDFRAMKECLDSTLSMASRADASDVVATTYGGYKNMYELSGDTVLARRYELLYYKQQAECQRRGEAGKLQEMETQYILDTVNEDMRRLMEKSARQKLSLVFSIILLTIASGGGFYIWRNYKREKEAHHRLYEANVRMLEAEDSSKEERRKYAGSNLREDDKEALAERVRNIMESSPEIFTEGFTIDRLAQLIHSRSRYVSQALNELCNTSFPKMLAEARIKEACRRLNDIENYGMYTSEALGEGVGFKSRTHFIATFKKFTGLTPAQYRKARLETLKKTSSPAEE